MLSCRFGKWLIAPCQQAVVSLPLGKIILCQSVKSDQFNSCTGGHTVLIGISQLCGTSLTFLFESPTFELGNSSKGSWQGQAIHVASRYVECTFQ